MSNQFKRLWMFMKGNRTLYLGAIIAVGMATVFSYIGPLVIKVTIDSIIGQESLQVPTFADSLIQSLGGTGYLAKNLWICGIALVILTLGRGFFSFYHGKWAAEASESIIKKIRETLYNHIQRLPFSYHVKAETGDLIQRCTSDVETIRRFIAVQFVEVGRALFMLAIAVPILLSLSPALSLVAMPIIPIIVTFSVIFFKKVQKAFTEMDEAEGRMSTVLQENLTGVRVVRAFGRQNFEVEKFDKKSFEFKVLTAKLIRLFAIYWSTTDFMTLAQTVAILVAGSYMTINGSITIGTLVVFMTYMGMLMWPVRQLGRILSDMGKMTVALKRIGEILDEKQEAPSEKGEKPAVIGTVEFDHVGFSYDGKTQILQDISFRAEAGQTIAILGPTGSGKSSLVQLLPRLYDITSGSIRIDGIDIRDIDRNCLRESIGFVLQEPFLYAKTVKENIGLARNESMDDDIFHASRMACIHDDIEGFEQGWQTLVGERGVTLSGGQKQRVAIARALIQESPILVFDDSLSAVDTETDAAIREALAVREKKATTFIISHRLTTLSQADMILVIQEGKIMQSGTHKELLERDGLYKRIWEIQSSLGNEIDPAEIDKALNKDAEDTPGYLKVSSWT